MLVNINEGECLAIFYSLDYSISDYNEILKDEDLDFKSRHNIVMCLLDNYDAIIKIMKVLDKVKGGKNFLKNYFQHKKGGKK